MLPAMSMELAFCASGLVRGVSSVAPRRRIRSQCSLRASGGGRGEHALFTSPQYLHNFLTNVWNKRPYVFKGLFADFASPLTPDDLAALSCLEESSARIIETVENSEEYLLQLGPFSEETFSTLPDRNWTLLVQECNRYVPELAELLEKFSFIPNWRVDDVMVSYAVRGGGVGPHVDNYDVFLVQASGKRSWKVGYTAIQAKDEELVENCDVRVLKGGFKVDEEWIVEKGDVVYIPPRFPHYGVGLDDECMTFSVGFKAPNLGQVLCGWGEDVAQTAGLHGEYVQDCEEQLVTQVGDPGRISEDVMETVYAEMLEKLQGEEGKRRFKDWFARELTVPKRHVPINDDGVMGLRDARRAVHEMVHRAEQGEDVTIWRREGSTFAYRQHKHETWLYVDGSKWQVGNVGAARALCNRRIDVGRLVALFESHEQLKALLEDLFVRGLVCVKPQGWGDG